MFKRGYGPRNAKIVIVGEAFGAQEEISNIPFSGASGHLLTKMLIRAGINRTDCYITNVVNARPHNNKFEFFLPILEKAIEFLKEDLKEIKPNIIIAVGKTSLNALTGKDSIEKWRGSIIPTEMGKVIGTYHPAHILRAYEKRSIAELDFVKARKESYSREFEEITYVRKIQPSFSDVLEFINKGHKRLSFDIETLGEHTRCLGFGYSRTEAICIPFIKNRTEHYWSLSEEMEILRYLDLLFKETEIKKIAQNFPFDSSVLARDFGFQINGLEMDTMIAAHCCYCELPKSLAFLASIYTDVPYWKTHNTKSDTSEFDYNCLDCISTFQLADSLKKEMIELNVFDFYNKHCQPLMLAITEAGNRGVLIDQNYRERLKNETEIAIAEIECALTNYTS